MSALADPGSPFSTPTHQEAYDVGYNDGFEAGRMAERDAVAKRLAADVAARHSTWRSTRDGKIRNRVPEQRVPEQRAVETRTYADAAGFIHHVAVEDPREQS